VRSEARRQAITALSARPTGKWFRYGETTGHDTNQDTNQSANEVSSSALLRNGDSADAIAQYWKALELVHKQSLLAEQEARVEKKLAVGYLRASQSTDAIPIYQKLLDPRKEDCGTASQKPADCADAEFELGRAKMYAGDFSGALVKNSMARFTNFR